MTQLVLMDSMENYCWYDQENKSDDRQRDYISIYVIIHRKNAVRILFHVLIVTLDSGLIKKSI